MKDYVQPSFYRFNEDSFFLINYIKDLPIKKWRNGLDAGAGVGVIGIEVLNGLSTFNSFTFCEKQKEFKPFLLKNLETQLQKKQVKVDVMIDSIENLNKGYDLILSNPPYFISGQGRKSPNEQREKCRSWTIDNCLSFLDSIQRLLSDDGEAFFLSPLDLSKMRGIDYPIRACARKGSLAIFHMVSLNKN